MPQWVTDYCRNNKLCFKCKQPFTPDTHPPGTRCSRSLNDLMHEATSAVKLVGSVGITATIDHPIPMQLSTGVGAAAKKYAVPPKVEEQRCAHVTVSLNAVGGTTYDISAPMKVAAQCMIVDGVLHGQPATILIDSGAQLSHISSAFVDKHRIPTRESAINTTLVMANGNRQPAHKMVVDAELQLNGCQKKVDMLVMPMTHYDVILGMSWHYAHYPVIYDVDTVQYMHESMYVYCDGGECVSEDKSKKLYLCCCSHTCTTVM